MERKIMDENIKVLIKLGYPLVEINNTLYNFTGFTGHSPHVFKSVLVGRDLTSILDSSTISLNLSNYQSQMDAVKNKIENLPIERKEFSPDYSYIIHLPN